ncbi:hypothetical protein ABZ477_07355 [Microbacterium sp. NPDC019599]|uniref:hypothetical protein n=1 Tax=Microbacterium sp. NPDC019599 TaxID=3154690 RepID=UPI0033DD5E2F
MTTPVRTDLDAYRVAIAELPLRAAASRDTGGAVVALSGDGEWWGQAADAIARGAAAVVVAHPAAAPASEIDALASRADGVPIVLDRPLLRTDVAASVTATLPALHAPAVLAIECHAPDGALPPALRDAIGWARILGRAPLTCRTAESWSGRSLALLETAGHEPVSIIAATQPGAPPLGRLRITALAETLVEIDDDADLSVTMTDAAGRRTWAPRFEGPERLALRRAIEAADARRRTPDLGDLRHDAAVAALVATASRS